MRALRTVAAFVLLTLVAVGLYNAAQGRPWALLLAIGFPLAMAMSPESDAA